MKFILLIFLVTLSASHAQNRWEKLNGPPGGPVRGLYIKGDTLLAGVGGFRGSIFYSFDKGINWRQADLRVSSRVSDFIFTDDEGILAAGGRPGIYKSYDFVNWEKVYGQGSSFFKFGKDTNGNIYVGNESVILVSSDNGYNWSLSFDGGIGFIQNFILMKNGDLYSGGRRKIFKKTHNSSWDSIIVSSVQQEFAPFSDDEENIYAYSNNYLFRSTNEGEDWIELDTNRFLNTIFIDKMIFNSRIIGGGGAIAGFHPNWGIVVSDDTGYTWKVSNNGLPPEFSGVGAIVKQDNETFIGIWSAGVFYSSDYGESWLPRNNGLNSAYTEDVIFPDDGYIYTASYGCGIARSPDKGETWEILNNGLSSSYTSSIIEADEGILLTGTASGTFRSTDRGEHWVQTAGDFLAYNMFKDKQHRIYALTWGSGLYRSTDTGLSWTRLDQGFMSDQVIAMAIDSSGILYAGAAGCAIYKSTNDGISWSEIYRSNNIAFINSLTIAPNGYIFVCSDGEGLLRSTDSGNTWQLMTNGIPSKRPWAVRVTEKEEVIVSTERYLPSVQERHIYSSTNYGESWKDITGEMGTILVDDFKIDKDGYIYLTTDESLWRSTLLSTSSNENEPEVMLEYSLSQNYPNPFNPSTKISYTLKDEGYVKLNIYDIKGELISTLVNEKQQSGNYEVDFTLPGNISTGVYIYRLTVTDNNSTPVFSDVKKMVYLK